MISGTGASLNIRTVAGCLNYKNLDGIGEDSGLGWICDMVKHLATLGPVLRFLFVFALVISAYLSSRFRFPVSLLAYAVCIPRLFSLSVSLGCTVSSNVFPFLPLFVALVPLALLSLFLSCLLTSLLSYFVFCCLFLFFVRLCLMTVPVFS